VAASAATGGPDLPAPRRLRLRARRAPPPLGGVASLRSCGVLLGAAAGRRVAALAVAGSRRLALGGSRRCAEARPPLPPPPPRRGRVALDGRGLEAAGCAHVARTVQDENGSVDSVSRALLTVAVGHQWITASQQPASYYFIVSIPSPPSCDPIDVHRRHGTSITATLPPPPAVAICVPTQPVSRSPLAHDFPARTPRVVAEARSDWRARRRFRRDLRSIRRSITSTQTQIGRGDHAGAVCDTRLPAHAPCPRSPVPKGPPTYPARGVPCGRSARRMISRSLPPQWPACPAPRAR
jgi:hypothetical protein